MNMISFYDEKFIDSESYEDFMKVNSSNGNLRIRAYAASQALPIKGLKVIVSKIIDNNEVVFFEGFTNESGLTERISLPAPKLDPNILDVPNKATYDIYASYQMDNFNQKYEVNIYDGVCVLQDISIVPDMTIKVGDF